jgi:hypothetical protein
MQYYCSHHKMETDFLCPPPVLVRFDANMKSSGMAVARTKSAYRPGGNSWEGAKKENLHFTLRITTANVVHVIRKNF